MLLVADTLALPDRTLAPVDPSQLDVASSYSSVIAHDDSDPLATQHSSGQDPASPITWQPRFPG